MLVTIIDIVKGGMQMAVLRYSKQRESIKNYLCGRETDGADRFDARVTPHNHFICRRCGRVMDMMVSVDSPVAEANKLWEGGEIHECRMEFYGICKDCKKTEN